MYIVDEPIETVHVYVIKEQPKKPYIVLPLVCALLFLAGIAAITVYSIEHPYYEHERLTVPATFLPLKTFTAQAPIIPTGVKTYPAVYAIGMLTLTNGSVLSEVLPAGVIFSGANGTEVQTTASAFIPAGSASGYGVATVPARALTAGNNGNIQTLAVNAVYGTALYIRNLAPFHGGKDGYSLPIVTPHDTQLALNTVRAVLAVQKLQINAILAAPCGEAVTNHPALIQLSITCRFATYHVPPYMQVTAARLSGEHFLVDVAFLPQPRAIVRG